MLILRQTTDKKYTLADKKFNMYPILLSNEACMHLNICNKLCVKIRDPKVPTRSFHDRAYFTCRTVHVTSNSKKRLPAIISRNKLSLHVMEVILCFL